jgi:hypothetical protein
MAGIGTRLAALAIAGACAFLPAAPATACGTSPHIAYIHSALPKPLPRGTFIALVDLDPRGDRAWIRRMIQGDRPGDYVVLRTTWWSSCNAPLANGRSGFLVAVVRGRENGILVVDPIEVGPEENYRLPDGWQLPEGFKPTPLTDEPGAK